MNLIQNNLNLSPNEHFQEKNLNANNYSNYTNEMQNKTTTNLRGKNTREEGLIDTHDPQLNMRLDTYPNSVNEPIPFRGRKAVRLFGGCIILLSLVGSLRRPDFPNLVEGVLVVLCCYIGIKRGISKGNSCRGKAFKYSNDSKNKRINRENFDYIVSLSTIYNTILATISKKLNCKTFKKRINKANN